MRFVDNDGVVFIKKTVMLGLRQQNTIGHQLYPAGIDALVGKAHLIANLLTKLTTQFFSNSLRNRTRSQTPWLGMSNPPLTAKTGFQANFR